MTLTSVIFLVSFVAGCFLAFARHPIYGLLTYTAVYYLHPPSRWWGVALPDLRWSLLVAVITLIAVLVRPTTGASVSVFRHKVLLGAAIFLGWVAIQAPWAYDPVMHEELLTLMAKYVLLVMLIYKCVDSEKHLRYFLWAHVLGCFYLGWIAFTTYLGGRFEGFGSPDINEANSAALQITTGIFIASSLFLAGKFYERAALFGGLPFIVNALIVTISRSGFLAAGLGGVVFNYFTPRRFRLRVGVLSVLALVLFALLTNPQYWTRIATLQYAGEEVEGIDTGAGRLVLMQAQWAMFLAHPLGCGHRCTAVLSPQYLSDEHLTGEGENRARSSHSTPMTMLVEHGVPGVVLYVLLLLWLYKAFRQLRRSLRHADEGLLPMLLPGIAASLAAITIGDLFVDYLKLEVRVWMVSVLMVMLRMTAAEAFQESTARGTLQKAAPAGQPGSGPKTPPRPAGAGSQQALRKIRDTRGLLRR